ncbi:glycoside hydrolase family 3 protein [Arthrobacter sp. 2MCAF15]|uniref:glycoside hydrolase family 3 protein n=1 Tax=Arthrobacter sp. 2MCAF15 TaxID=3232984 RepID=UPI003F8FA657
MIHALSSAAYLDRGLTLERRVSDLIERMTLEEKAGLLFQAMITMNPDGTLAEDAGRAPTGASTSELVGMRMMTAFNLLGASDPGSMARWHNALQELAMDTRLGIPVSIASDPRNAFSNNPGTAAASGPFSKWPETLGLAAIGDADLVRRYADTVRREYLAVGLRVALHPQIDLATEPRWSRAEGTFGQDAEVTSRLVAAYLEGLRGGRELGADSVAGMVKHFPGGGPQKDGEDPHFPYGKDQVYPGGYFEHHLKPFRAAIAAGATQIMPYYGRPMGTEYEPVGFGFNRGIITGLLREQLGFDGIVCTDWGIITDNIIMGELHEARAWGVEQLSPEDRILRVLDAGADQFGGEQNPHLVVELVRSGRLDEARLDVSVARLLREKFRLGLFDDARFVDPDQAEEIVGNAAFAAEGRRTQSKSMTLLTNRPQSGPPTTAGTPVLPIREQATIYLQGIEAPGDGSVVAVRSATEAQAAVIRLETPFDPRPGVFESFFRAGRLDFSEQELAPILDLLDRVPTIVVIHMDRPAVIPEIVDRAAAVIVDYGAGDEAVWDVLLGRIEPAGTLPFELPRSMAAVKASRPDVPSDTMNPVFPFGHGLRPATAAVAD